MWHIGVELLIEACRRTLKHSLLATCCTCQFMSIESRLVDGRKDGVPCIVSLRQLRLHLGLNWMVQALDSRNLHDLRNEKPPDSNSLRWLPCVYRFGLCWLDTPSARTLKKHNGVSSTDYYSTCRTWSKIEKLRMTTTSADIRVLGMTSNPIECKYTV